MSSTLLASRDLGSPVRAPRPSPRWIALGLTLFLACAKGATLPDAPVDVLHYPAWLAAFGDKLLVVNLDQDLAYDNGALVSIDAAPGTNDARPVLGGVAVANMAGRLLVIDEATVGACAGHLASLYPVPFALVAGRFEDVLYVVPLTAGAGQPVGKATKIGLHPSSASEPFGLGFSCSADGTPRAWVGYLAGQNSTGYVTRVDLSKESNQADRIVQVNVGKGALRSFAYDADRDRLYFTGREVDEAAPIRWIQVGAGGCPAAAIGTNHLQDERKGGCHVDPGFDLSLQFRGAEPNDIALSSTTFECTSGAFKGTPCRRAYVSVRMYDADLASALGGRPSTDLGGKLMVLELPEGGLGRPEPQVVADLDIGRTAGLLQVIPRAGQRDLVAVTAVDDSLLWLYDDQLGQMVKVFGRSATGVPPLGHQLTALASQDLGGGMVRLFVTSYRDGWVSAVDVDLADPSGEKTAIVRLDPTDPSSFPWRLGVAP